MKTYQKPQCSVLELHSEQFLTLSKNDEKGGKQLAPAHNGWSSDDWASSDDEE